MPEYIDREAAVNVACAAVWYGGGVPSIAEAINALSSADVEPVRHGTWIPRLYGKRVMYVCSLCERRQSGRPDYCSKCGATMDGRLNHENLLSR